MRRKSTRNLSKSSPVTEAPVRKSRRTSKRRKKSTSSHSENSDEEQEVKPLEQEENDEKTENVDELSASPKRHSKDKMCKSVNVQQEQRRSRRRGSPKSEESTRQEDEEDKKGKGKSKGKHKSKIEKTHPLNECEAHNEHAISENVQVTPESPQTNTDNPVDNEHVTVIEKSVENTEDVTVIEKSVENTEDGNIDQSEDHSVHEEINCAFNDKSETDTALTLNNDNSENPIIVEVPSEQESENCNKENINIQSNEKEVESSFNDNVVEVKETVAVNENTVIQEVVSDQNTNETEQVIIEAEQVIEAEKVIEPEKVIEKDQNEVIFEYVKLDDEDVTMEEIQIENTIQEVVAEKIETTIQEVVTEKIKTTIQEIIAEKIVSTIQEAIAEKIEKEDIEIAKKLEIESKVEQEIEEQQQETSKEEESENIKESENEENNVKEPVPAPKKDPIKTKRKKIEISRNSDDASKKVIIHRKWGTAPVILDQIAPHLIHVDLNTIKSFSQNFHFLEETEVKLDHAEIKDRRKSLAEHREKKTERKVSLDDSVRPNYGSQFSDQSTKSEDNMEVDIDNSNIIAMNRKISIVDDSASKLKPPPSPARNPVSEVLYITNLVRPFTLKQLKELLERTGKIAENGFWTDRIKSKCYVQYESSAEAEDTRNALHGVHWPIGNGKKLIIDYATPSDLENARNPRPPTPPPAPPTPAATDINKHEKELKEVQKKLKQEEEQKLKEREREKEKERHRSEHVREWDVGKENVHRRHSRSRDRHEKRRRSHHSPSPVEDYISRKQRKHEDQHPQKLMDDLFQKTKATPSIYWQPLTPEEIATKQQQRLERMAEHKRRMEETSRTRADYGRGGPYRRRYD